MKKMHMLLIVLGMLLPTVTMAEKFVKNSKSIIISNFFFSIIERELKKLVKNSKGFLILRHSTSFMDGSISHNSRFVGNVNMVILAYGYRFFSALRDGEANNMVPIPKNLMIKTLLHSSIRGSLVKSKCPIPTSHLNAKMILQIVGPR